MPAALTVEVHEALKELLPGFLDSRQRDLQELAHCLESADFPAIARIAHNMKGAGGGYGFDQVSVFGERLEQAASDADPAAAAACLADYRRFMQHCQIVFV